MRWMSIFTLFFISSHLSAKTLETTYLWRLSQTREPRQIDQLTRQYADLKVARTACRIQLHEHTVPSACYESLRLETALGLHPKTTEKMRLLRHLDDLCRNAAAALRIGSLNVAPTSTTCAREVQRARMVQEYRQEDVRSAESWSGS